MQKIKSDATNQRQSSVENELGESTLSVRTPPPTSYREICEVRVTGGFVDSPGVGGYDEGPDRDGM